MSDSTATDPLLTLASASAPQFCMILECDAYSTKLCSVCSTWTCELHGLYSHVSHAEQLLKNTLIAPATAPSTAPVSVLPTAPPPPPTTEPVSAPASRTAIVIKCCVLNCDCLASYTCRSKDCVSAGRTKFCHDHYKPGNHRQHAGETFKPSVPNVS